MTLKTEPLTAEAFAPFGDVLEAAGTPDMVINGGLCGRFHDRAKLAFDGGRPAISIFRGELKSMPYSFDMVERHPLGSQAFIPMSNDPFLVIVAPDENGTPGAPRAFMTTPYQGINLHQNVWHGVLTPLSGPGLFMVFDREGDGVNLETYTYPAAMTVTA